MARRMSLPGGDLEYAVLVALWDLGEATAREVHARVAKRNAQVYTTVTKVLERLMAKGLVERTRLEKAFVFRASVPRDRVERARAKDMLVRLFGLGTRPPVAALVDAFETTDPDLLDELGRAVAARQKGRHES